MILLDLLIVTRGTRNELFEVKADYMCSLINKVSRGHIF